MLLEVSLEEWMQDVMESAVLDPSSERIATLVIGIGNNLFGDDGAGIHVIEQLRAADLPDGVELVDGGTLSFTLLDFVEETDRLIVVDAAELHADPGTVEIFKDEAMDEFLTSSKRPSVHEVNLLDVLVAARIRGTLPERRTLVGIQPLSLDWSSTPTPEVAKGVAKATEAISAMCRDAA